jgi:hypothetical protein
VQQARQRGFGKKRLAMTIMTFLEETHIWIEKFSIYGEINEEQTDIHPINNYSTKR